MKLATMRFKGVTFACNPLSLEISDEADVTKQLFSQIGEKIGTISPKLRKVKGRGELRGSECIEQYANLRMLQREKGAGLLSLPGIKPFYAIFTKLTGSADVTPDTVFFEFEFLEKASFSEKPKEKKYHRVTEGETLFDIAYDCKVKVDTLVLLNPQIRRPDELESGELVRIC